MKVYLHLVWHLHIPLSSLRVIQICRFSIVFSCPVLWIWWVSSWNCSAMASGCKPSKLWSTMSAILRRSIICSFTDMVLNFFPQPPYGTLHNLVVVLLNWEYVFSHFISFICACSDSHECWFCFRMLHIVILICCGLGGMSMLAVMSMNSIL